MIDQLIHIFLQSSWQILLLGLIVWPLSRLSIRATPNFAYSLWVIILIKALIPINITLPSQQIPVMQISPIITGQFIQTMDVPSPAIISTTTLIFVVWMAIVFFLLVKLLVSEIRHRNQMKTAEELVPEAWFEDMKATLGINQKLQVFVNPKIQSPLMQGLWQVRIYLPRQYRTWTQDEQKSVLAHELMHIKRKDIIIIYLQALVRTLYFFHPMVWLVNDQIDLEREKICDDAAIDLAQSERGTYGHQLFKQLSSLKGGKSTPVLAGGFFMTDSSVIKRFRYIKEKRGNMQGKLRIYHVLLILLVISLAIIVACSQETEKTSVTSTAIGNTSGKIVLNGIIYDGDKPFAIINGEIYGEGDQVSGHTLIEISDDMLTLEKDGETIHIDYQKVKESSDVPPSVNDNVVFKAYDVPPEPVGGYRDIQEAIHYPALAKKAGIQGTVIVQVTIDTNGVAKDPIVLRGVDEILDLEALEAIVRVDWKPAQIAGKPVAVKISVPVVFRLKTDEVKKMAKGIKPISTLRKVPVVLRGPNAGDLASHYSYEIYINSDGVVENTRMAGPNEKDGVSLDKEAFIKAMQPWLDSKWESIAEGQDLVPQWIKVPFEFTIVK